MQGASRLLVAEAYPDADLTEVDAMEQSERNVVLEKYL